MSASLSSLGGGVKVVYPVTEIAPATSIDILIPKKDMFHYVLDIWCGHNGAGTGALDNLLCEVWNGSTWLSNLYSKFAQGSGTGLFTSDYGPTNKAQIGVTIDASLSYLRFVHNRIHIRRENFADKSIMLSTTAKGTNNIQVASNIHRAFGNMSFSSVDNEFTLRLSSSRVGAVWTADNSYSMIEIPQ